MRKHLFLALLWLSLFGAAQAFQETTLAQVARFDAQYIGFAGSESPNFQAFQAQTKRGAAAKPVFEKLLLSGTPAAKLYSAIGLYSLDKARGTAALQALTKDPSKVGSMDGCDLADTTVAELAKDLLKDDCKGVARFLR